MSKSGIEMLEEILEKVNLLSKRLEITEQNMKEILNRLNQNKSIVKETTQEKPTITSTVPVPTEAQLPATTKVLGKLKNKEEKMLAGVLVKIFNSGNKMIKETKTNRAGEWMCFLPPGHYKAEYSLENVINTNVSFNISPEQQLLRVPQPTGV
jgi:hypothetical protein